MYWLAVRLIRFFTIVLCRWEITGRENAPGYGPVIVSPNHTSHVDPPVAGSALDRQLYYMAKAELFEVPVFGWIIYQVGSFPVRRGVADRTALRQAEQLLREGQGVVVFPEGTRSPDGRLQAGELGAAMLALRTGAPVLPIGVDGTDRVLPRGSVFIRPAKIRIRIGKLLTFEDLRGEGAVTRATAQIAADRIMKALAELLPEWRSAPGRDFA